MAVVPNAPLTMLCLLCLAAAGCRVYDTTLVETRRFASSDASVLEDPAAADGDVPQTATETSSIMRLPGCGNGQLDDTERCDTAIAAGQPGACPQGCVGQVGCREFRLTGQRCGTHCQELEVTALMAGDGCCPNQASPDTDSDCSATCGDGVVDSGETCDPAESCPRSETCVTDKACTEARITGSPSTCNARCEEHAIEQCASGDGCCPNGCTRANDGDCTSGSATSTEAPTAPPDASTTACTGPECEPAGDPVKCMESHAAGRCQACDCAYCSDQALACLTGNAANDNAACAALLDCATETHCSGIDCYCGSASLTNCERFPLGPCANQIRLVAGSREVFQILFTASNMQTVLGRAATMLSCRAEHCGEVCGL